MRTTARLLTAALTAAAVSLIVSAPATAGQVQSPKYRDAFEDNVCGIDAHVVVQADNPIIETGRIMANGEPSSLDSGHVVVHFTNLANGHWTEDGFSGPARVISAVRNADGSTSKRVIFTGTKRQFSAWDGTVVSDRGRLVVDYLISADDQIISRTVVSQVGDFPIASAGQNAFCDFMSTHLA